MTELYKGDGRLTMARALQEMWPKYVEVKWKFGRAQHSVNWKKFFKQDLIRKENIDFSKLRNYDINLKVIKEVKSESLKKLLTK